MSQEKLNGAVDRSLERAVGERKGSIDAHAAPDPELVERARRRRFTAEYKLRIVREADACTRPGEIGALLRREGLYSSHLILTCVHVGCCGDPGAAGEGGDRGGVCFEGS
jgi:hypothetical protein